jgi:hypothetical protein
MDQVNPSSSSSSTSATLSGGPQVPTGTTPTAAPPQRPSLMRWLIKGLLFVLVLVTVRLFSAIRRFPIVALIIVMVIAGTWMALSSGVVALPRWASVGGAPVASDGRLSVETYLTGQQQLNSALMWEALSEEARAAMQRAGGTANDLQARLERDKRAGISYTDYQFIIATPLKDGRSVYLYIASADVATQQGTMVQQIPFTFTVDKSGKILNVE